jgi:3-oxoacyl-[acyl-carrier-protein] synthase II
MTVAVTGWSVLSSAGIGAPALAGHLEAAGGYHPGRAVRGMYPEPLPAADGHALVDFDIRAHLGRRGTSFYDRATALAVVGCQEALREADLHVDDDNRTRVGVVLGTSVGSFKSTSDFSRETLVQDKPYLVNPVLFPNTVMNGAAGQAAIRFGLQGVNATVAGGPLAFLNAVRYATNAIKRGYADVMLTGAVEEYTPHRAWAVHHAGRAVPAGEAAAVFVLSAAGTAAAGSAESAAGGRRPEAEVLGVATAYGPGGEASGAAALEGVVRRLIRRCGVDPADVSTVLTGEADPADQREYEPAARALGHRPRLIQVARLLGECDAAGAAVALAALLTMYRRGSLHRGTPSLLTSRSADGGVAAAIVRGVQA